MARPQPKQLQGKSHPPRPRLDKRKPVAGRCNFRRPDGTYCHNFVHTCHHQKHVGSQASRWKGGISKGWLRKHLPQRLIKTFNTIVNDPNLVSVRGLMGVTGARLNELLDKLPTKESGAAWLQLLELLDLALAKSTITEKERPLLERCLQLTKESLRERELWTEIHDVIERQRKLADTERKREEMLQGNLTAAQALALFQALFTLIGQEVTDELVRRRIADGLTGLLRQQPGMRIAAVSDEQADVVAELHA